ncbi:probable WRKY transcription factor 29 [Phaseolus vulgaris]
MICSWKNLHVRVMVWDLQSIVGCTIAPATTMDNPNLILSQGFCAEPDDLLYDFQEFSETKTVLNELEEIYKPFYPNVHHNPHPIISSSQPIPDKNVKELKLSNKVDVQAQDLHDTEASTCRKSKKKQNKKRVVKHMNAVDGVSDPWAWRKYGQKPIKGSPYPRSYYRCSSSKGCLARKFVELSHLDPGVLIVTYTAEHSPHPTRKNSRTGRGSSTIAPPTTHSDDMQTLSSRINVVVEALEVEHERFKVQQ